MTNPLLMPLELRNITLPGRAVRSATELFNGAPDGHVRPAEIAVYQELSDKNLGMIIGANTCVSPEGRSNDYQTALWSDEFLPDAEAIAKAASSAGSKVILQLGHGGHQSEGHNWGMKVMTPDNMTKEEIKTLVKNFGAAARRAMQAGFDGVMIHAAHTFLLSTFFYPYANHRTDEYGGCAENRFRVIREVYEEIKAVCGDQTPVFMKINGDDHGNTPEYHADMVTALTICDRMGMDAVEISGMQSIQRSRSTGPYFLHRIRALHAECDIPLISVGGVRKMADVEALFEAGASAISFSRPLIQNPDVVRAIMEGGESDCVGCSRCFTPALTFEDIKKRCPMRKN